MQRSRIFYANPQNPSRVPMLMRKGISENTMPVMLDFLATAYTFSAMVTAFLLCFVTQCLAVVLLFPILISPCRLRYTLLGSIFRFWHSLFVIRLNPFWNVVVVRSAPKGYSPSKTIVMVNHTSGSDPWICCWALFPWELKYIVKGELFKIPIAGWCLKMAGDLAVRFTKEKGGWGTEPGSVKKMMARATYLQQKGVGQVVFPEGTRSATGRLQMFKDGFFRLAIENHTEILPCVIHNAQQLWPLGSHSLRYGTAYFAFGNPLTPQEGDTVETLKARVRGEMLDLLKLCPLYDQNLDSPLDAVASTRGLGLAGARVSVSATAASFELDTANTTAVNTPSKSHKA